MYFYISSQRKKDLKELDKEDIGKEELDKEELDKGGEISSERDRSSLCDIEKSSFKCFAKGLF